MRRLRAALIIAVFSFSATIVPGQERFTKTSVCRVLKLGMVNRIREVEIDADVVSDGMHASILTDAKCPGRGLYLGVVSQDADPSVASFTKALWSDGAPGTTGRHVSGKFFGRLQLDHNTKKVSISLARVKDLLNVRTNP